MRLFHLGWWDDQLYLWGETSDEEAQVEASDSTMLPRACRGEPLIKALESVYEIASAEGIALFETEETLPDEAE